MKGKKLVLISVMMMKNNNCFIISFILLRSWNAAKLTEWYESKLRLYDAEQWNILQSQTAFHLLTNYRQKVLQVNNWREVRKHVE